MYYPLEGLAAKRYGILSIDIVADGPTFVVKLTDWSEDRSIFRQHRKSKSSGSTVSEPSPFEIVKFDLL